MSVIMCYEFQFKKDLKLYLTENVLDDLKTFRSKDISVIIQIYLIFIKVLYAMLICLVQEMY